MACFSVFNNVFNNVSCFVFKSLLSKIALKSYKPKYTFQHPQSSSPVLDEDGLRQSKR